jgi:hypothetical protein
MGTTAVLDEKQEELLKLEPELKSKSKTKNNVKQK